MNFFKKLNKKEKKAVGNSKEAAKERLHLVLMQDRANVSADFLELMKQEIIEVNKKYIDVDEGAIDVRLTNKENGDGTNGAPALYANIPILNIKNEARKVETKHEEKKHEEKKQEENKQEESKKEQETKTEKNLKENVEKQELKKEHEETVVKEEIKTAQETEEEKKQEAKKEKAKEKIKSEN